MIDQAKLSSQLSVESEIKATLAALHMDFVRAVRCLARAFFFAGRSGKTSFALRCHREATSRKVFLAARLARSRTVFHGGL